VRSPNRRRGPLLALTLLALLAPILALTGAPAATAYPGAPWFQPSTTYLDLSRPDAQNNNFPDASIISDGGTYYAYSAPTGGAYLPVMASTDLVHWTARPAYPGGMFGDPYFNDAMPTAYPWGVDRPGSGRMTKELWAPGAARIGGNVVVFHAVRMSLSTDRFCIGASVSPDPLGPFTPVGSGPLVCGVQGDPNGSIDPQPFVDVDGRAYLVWKSEGVPGSQPTRIWSQPLDGSGTAFAPGSSPHALLETSAPWEGDVIENPAMVRWNGRLLLFYSANEWTSANYAIGYAECPSVDGPCTKVTNGGPLLGSNGTRLGPGGPAPFVDASGRLRLGYHYWLTPYVGYPANASCDGPNRCTSQGQRRLAIDEVVPNSGGTVSVIPFSQGGDCGAGVATAPANRGTFTPLAPQRVLDTRVGLGASRFPVGPGRAISVQVRGVGGVPNDPSVAAVALNVTATEATFGGFLTVHPTDVSLPTASNLNMVPGQTIPGLVIAKVGPDGRACVYNAAGTTHVLADVVGWFASGDAPGGATLTAVNPMRVLDTRNGIGHAGTVGTQGQIDLQLAPPPGATGVVLNVTTAEPTASRSFITIWPAGEPRPNASSLNMVAGETAPNLVFARLGAGGAVSLYNDLGDTHLLADVLGWFGPPAGGGRFTPVAPARVLDTRAFLPVGPDGTLDLHVTGNGGVPAAGVSAVVLNVTATQPSATTYVTAWPTGEPRPEASNLNVLAGQTRPNLVVARVGSDGNVSLYNAFGSTHLVADVVGWFD
jgi:hypothetical protein